MILLKKERRLETLDQVKLLTACKKEKKKAAAFLINEPDGCVFSERAAAVGLKRLCYEIPAQLWGLQTP